MKKQLLYSILLLFIGAQMANAHSIIPSETTETYERFEPSNPIAFTTNSTSMNASATAAKAENYTIVAVESRKTSVTSNPATSVKTLEVIITSQPQASTTLCAGQPLNLNVTATGTNLVYQWFKGTTSLVGQTNATLNIPQVTNSNAGTYTVVITSSNQVITSSNAVVIVNDLPWATVAASGPTVCEGQPTFLSFTGTPNATVTYSDGSNNFTIALNNSGLATVITAPLFATTTFTLVSAEDFNTAQCSSTLAGSVTIMVNASFEVILQPFETTICEGQSATFTVATTAAGFTYMWYGPTGLIATTTNASYTIANATAANAGDYMVEVIDICGTTVLSNPAFLIIAQETIITTQPQEYTTVCVGQPVTLSVTATGTNLTYQWFKEGVAIAGATGPTFTISSSTLAYSGTYICSVTTFCGSTVYSIASNEAVVVVNNGAGGLPCGDTIQLVAFVDANSNGVKEETEAGFGYGSFTFQKNNAGPIYYVTSPMGVQNIYDDNPANTYDFDFEINSEYAAYYAETPTNFNDLSIAFGSGVQTLYFPITVTQVYNDVEVSITALSVPRPGFSYTHKIIYKNKGHNPTSGTITYTKSNANIAITSTLPIATTTTSNGFTYDYSNLLPGETRSIFVNMLVATIPTVNLGDVVTNTASITSGVSEVNTTNNTFLTTQIVVGSYDPNDKNEVRGSNVQIGQFNANDFLFYTIRFQNSGTASAETVRIEDTLASEFDFASIRMISASHDYTMQRINNNVVWTFDNINLPSENQDEPGSHGYVTFKIKLNPGFAVGDVIENNAEIYFDFNPAIITNTFQTTFVPNLSTGTFDPSQLVIYPNPAKEMVQVSITNSTETLSKIVIYDIIGKAIKTVSGNKAHQATVNVSDLSSGVYMIEITTDADLKQIRKFIVN